MRKFIHLMSNCFTAGLFTSILVPIAFLSLLLPLSLIALVFMFLVETFGSRELHNLFDEIFFYALFFNANPSYFFYFIYGCFVSCFCIKQHVKVNEVLDFLMSWHQQIFKNTRFCGKYNFTMEN